MAAVCAANIPFVVAHTFIGTRRDERRLKNRKNTPQICPVCQGTIKVCFKCGKTYKYLGWLNRHTEQKHPVIVN